MLGAKCTLDSSRAFIDRKKFWQLLVKEHPNYDKYRWFTGTLIDNAEYAYYQTEGHISLATIVSITRNALGFIRAKYPLVMFPDLMCGWKGTVRRNSSLPLCIHSIHDINDTLERHVYFRSKDGIENYYITDSNLKWFIIIDHEGLWSFSAPWHMGCKLEIGWKKVICSDASLKLCQPTRITSTVEFKRAMALNKLR